MDESNYRTAFASTMEELKRQDPVVVARNSCVQYLAGEQMFIMPFFQRTCTVDCINGEVRDLKTRDKCGYGTGIIILNYLRTAQDKAVNNCLISLKEVPHGGMLFYPAFKNRTINPLVAHFGNNSAAFEVVATQLGGQKIKLGHTAVLFQPLPKIAMTIVLWEGDEELPGSANILFDSSISNFLPVEDIVGLGYYCSYKLIKYYASELGESLNNPFWDWVK